MNCDGHGYSELAPILRDCFQGFQGTRREIEILFQALREGAIIVTADGLDNPFVARLVERQLLVQVEPGIVVLTRKGLNTVTELEGRIKSEQDIAIQALKQCTGRDLSTCHKGMRIVERFLSSLSCNEFIAWMHAPTSFLARVEDDGKRYWLQHYAKADACRPLKTQVIRAFVSCLSKPTGIGGISNAHDQITEIVIDTNVLVDMCLAKNGPATAQCIKALTAQVKRPVFVILDITWAELLGHIRYVGNSCVGYIKAIREHYQSVSGNRDDNAVRTETDSESFFGTGQLRALGRQYLRQLDEVVSFRAYVNDCLGIVLGRCPIAGTNEIFLAAEQRCSHPRSEEARREMIKRIEVAGLKSPKERHDAAMLIYAHERNAELVSKGIGCCFVWTHHVDLYKDARALNIPDETARFGFTVLPHLHDLVPTMASRSKDAQSTNTEERDTAVDYIGFCLNLDKHGEQEPLTFEHDAEKLLWQLVRDLREWGLDPNPLPLSDEESHHTSEKTPEQAGVHRLLRISEMDDLSKWKSCNLDWSMATGGHGVEPLVFSRSRYAMYQEKGEYGPVAWRISPHCVTHMDLPWALDEEALRQLDVKPIYSRSNEQGISHYRWLTSARVHKAIQIEVPELLARMKACALDTASGEQLAELVWQLRIGLDCVTRIPREALHGLLLIVKTGWATEFQGGGADSLAAWEWEGHHPWLLHPWLTEAAIKYLVESGVSGIAIDAPMVDCPLCLARSALVRNRSLRAAYKSFLAAHGDSDLKQHGHLAILNSGRMMIECLQFPKQQLLGSETDPQNADTCIRQAEMALLPITLDVLDDAIPVSAFIRYLEGV